jgi:glycosyltransferase involved in cell wall biosynthesis
MLSEETRSVPLWASKRACFGDKNVRLIFKINRPRRYAGNVRLNDAVVRPFIAPLEGAPRATLLTDTLVHGDVLPLYKSPDAFVSLQRAEGPGLSPLEFMASAKPVVAADCPGNKAFMTPSCSCLAGHRLVPLDRLLPAYTSVIRGLSPVCAEPDLNGGPA